MCVWGVGVGVSAGVDIVQLGSMWFGTRGRGAPAAATPLICNILCQQKPVIRLSNSTTPHHHNLSGSNTLPEKVLLLAVVTPLSQGAAVTAYGCCSTLRLQECSIHAQPSSNYTVLHITQM